MNLKSFSDHKKRREALQNELNIKLDSIAHAMVDETKNIHCENLIGQVAIPLGVAGPMSLKINGKKIKVYIPLATSEGALVASVSRGCKAISLVGGAISQVMHHGATRGPVFRVTGIDQALFFRNWLKTHEKEIAKIAQSTSSHLKLLKIETSVMGRYVYVRFSFDPSEAMGMNMVTIATDAVVEYIVKKTKIECLALAGNFDIDKKPAWLNFIEGRGRSCWAEVILSKTVLEKVLKTTAEKLYEVVIAKCWGGSIMSGSMGFNAHFANIVAAFFAATGQDLGHVSECSVGVTSAEVLPGSRLYISVYLPDIMLGTVGGGTKLKTQTEARSIIGVKTADRLAGVLVAAVLAGELSLLASIAEKTLAGAHKKLGR